MEDRGSDARERFCQALQTYAGWGAVLRAQPRARTLEADYDSEHRAIKRIATAFRALAETERAHIAGLLKASDSRLAPLSDPLHLPFAGNRWLDIQREREESYSDWLAWLLEQMDPTKEVLRIFGLEGSAFGAFVGKEKCRIYREEGFWTTNDEFKRLDIVVRFGEIATLLVEVKIRELEAAGGADNLPAYLRWLEREMPDPRGRCSVLLVPNGIESP